MEGARPDADRSADSTRGSASLREGLREGAVLHGVRLGRESLFLTLIAAGHTCRAEHFFIARYPQQKRHADQHDRLLEPGNDLRIGIRYRSGSDYASES